MSYSQCYRCNAMVPGYDKYCCACQATHGLPDLPDYQRDHHACQLRRSHEVQKDMAKARGDVS